jgi:hypothetical protein
MAAVVLELAGEEIFFVHRSHLRSVLRHTHDERGTVNVTRRRPDVVRKFHDQKETGLCYPHA